MSANLSKDRRQVVIIGGSIAAMSGTIALLGRNHPWLGAVWLCFLLIAAAYVMVQLIKIRRSGR
jgi:hypothetical protein